MMKPSPDSFRLERHVSLALIFAVCLEAGGAIWWASAKDAQDFARDRHIAWVEERATRNEARQLDIIERLARLETHAENHGVLLRQIAQQAGRK